MTHLTGRELGQSFEVPVEGVLRPARFVAFAVNNGKTSYSFECTDGSGIFHIAFTLEGVKPTEKKRPAKRGPQAVV